MKLTDLQFLVVVESIKTHTTARRDTVNPRAMRKAVIILSLVAAIVAEAPYHIPRPGINYQQGGQHYQQHHQQNYFQNPGYQYQQPNIGPTFVQPGHIQPQVNQQQFIQRPNVVYGSPLLRHPLPNAQPLSVPQQAGYINGYPSQQGVGFNQGFVQNSYPQPIAQSPLAYNTQRSSFSSYQADNNAYSNQIHGEALDSTVVGRLENILRENEHVSAKNAGYISLVSGISLEGARPSVELSSFVDNSPLRLPSPGSSLQELTRGRSIQGTSAGYEVPSIQANSGSASQGQTGANFVQQNQVSSSYGISN